MKIILLNGPSSAGKSSIARELKGMLEGPVQVIALDDYLDMTPEEPIWEDDVFAVTPRMGADIAAALEAGESVIIDHVITSARIFEAIRKAIGERPCFRVLVTCDTAVLRQRERDRGNRCIGSAEASRQYLFPKDGYDLRIDSGLLQPGEAAERIAACADLTIRKMRRTDLTPLHALLSDPEVMRHIEPPFSSEKTEAFLQEAGMAEPPLIYAVDDGEGRFIGYVIYHGYEEDSVEIGWVLNRSAWGHGHAQALTALLIEKARNEKKNVVIECSPEQTVSQHIAVRNGFACCGCSEGLQLYRLTLR